MPGKRLSQRQKDRYINLRRRGMRQFEARELVRISRQSAHRLDESEGLSEVVTSERVPRPQPTTDLPTRVMPMETALRLLDTVRNTSDPAAIEGIINAVRGTVPDEILHDIASHLPSPTMAPVGAGGFSDLPVAAAEADDGGGGERYGVLSAATPPQAVAHNGLLKRTWSPDDRHLYPVSRAQAIRAARSKPAGHEGLRFYQRA